MTYFDHYWQSAEESALAIALAEHPNTLGPIYDPISGTWYGAVRSGDSLSVPAGCSLADAPSAQELLGVWA